MLLESREQATKILGGVGKGAAKKIHCSTGGEQEW
jgi:hypothetical protein